MATVKFLIRGKTNPSPIYLRFTHTREIDIFHKTQILVDPKNWDLKKEQIKNVIAVKNRNEINLKLSELKVFLVNEFNTSYIQGESIDREWLNKTTNEFFNRPDHERGVRIEKEKTYLTEFARWWMENIAPTYKISSDRYMGEGSISKYNRLIDILEEFQGKSLIKLSETDNALLDDFSSFLSNEKNYAESTTKRQLTRLKFFCERAESMNLKVNKGYKEIVFVKKNEEEFKAPYLNIEEIKKIYNLKISDKKIDAIRDNFIIGLWTGLRVSDFLNRLTTDNFQGGFIYIQTLKTKQKVAIPTHPQVKAILKKWEGMPPKTYDQEFNKEIKKICKMADITNVITGGLSMPILNKETQENEIRKVIGEYPKYKLVSSHICRRSFATNHFGKISNKVIMDVCGWKSEQQMLDYNKQTNIESAKELAAFWATQNN